MDENIIMKKGRPVRVLTYGTFDVLHRGHIRLLKRAKALGDYLIVAISTDVFNRAKGKNSVFPYRERKWILEHLQMVNKVIPEKAWEQKIHDVERYKIDVFVMGDDWKGKFDFLRPYCKVVYLPRTKGISTTQVKQRMQAIKLM